MQWDEVTNATHVQLAFLTCGLCRWGAREYEWNVDVVQNAAN